MDRAIANLNIMRNSFALRAALVLLPLWLSGCADDKKTDPPPTNTFDLTVSPTGSGQVISNPAGIDCGSDCAETLAAESSVTLNATPASGYTFTGWGGDCSGSTSCALTMSANRAVTATFTATPAPPPAQFTLTVSVTGVGTVTSTSGVINNCGSTCSATIPIATPATSVTLTATPGANQQFSGWANARR